MDSDFDIVVIGGGTAGVIAAVQSARRTALCEFRRPAWRLLRRLPLLRVSPYRRIFLFRKSQWKKYALF